MQLPNNPVIETPRTYAPITVSLNDWIKKVRFSCRLLQSNEARLTAIAHTDRISEGVTDPELVKISGRIAEELGIEAVIERNADCVIVRLSRHNAEQACPSQLEARHAERW